MDLLQRAQVAEPEVARECLEAAVRAANERIWVHRNAARIYREHLGDLAAARKVLREIAALTCSEWRLAAAGWTELGDLAEAVRCLERAATNAGTASDLCTVALGYRDSGYADEGLLLLDGADSLATQASDCWSLANTYLALGDFDRALATLERGLRDAVSVPERVALAHAFATYGAGNARLAEILADAERRAGTVPDWIQIAIAYHQLLFDTEAADRCTRQASHIAIDPKHERDIAVTRSRMTLQLLDDDRPRIAPANLLWPGSRSFGWDRDPARLLGWLRARIPRDSIVAMAALADFFTNDHFIALLDIAKSGLLPHPLPAYLGLLDQIRWREGPNVDHLVRAFACTLLCIEDAAVAIPEGQQPTIAVLLDSCIALGPDAVSAAISLFAAMADSYDAAHSTTRHAPTVLFAELGLVLAAAWLDPTDPRIPPLVDRLITDEPRYRASVRNPSPAWLLGLTRHDLRNALWRSLANRILVHPSHERLAALLVG
jgi:tetratricopeptide (TPR) repeat protein